MDTDDIYTYTYGYTDNYYIDYYIDMEKFIGIFIYNEKNYLTYI